MEILITICARGGSKGIPGKNIKELNGKPLINYTIDHAKAFAKIYNCDVALSTDDSKIKMVAASSGLMTDYVRPSELASDNAGKIIVIKELFNYESASRKKKYDYVLDLDVSAPMRTLEDIVTGFDLLKETPEAYNIFSVSPAYKNPYFNMVEPSEGKYCNISKPLPSQVKSRQQAPLVYQINGSFYIYTSKFFQDDNLSAITKRSLIYIMKHQCFDLDEPLDFEFLEFLIKNNKLDFKI